MIQETIRVYNLVQIGTEGMSMIGIQLLARKLIPEICIIIDHKAIMLMISKFYLQLIKEAKWYRSIGIGSKN